MRRIYREAAAVVTYGEHVSAYVRRHGATRVFVAPQAVDNAFWSAPARGRGADGASPPCSSGAARARRAWPCARRVASALA